MKTWYRKISREPDELQGYLPRFNTEEREEPRPQTVASPIIDSIETSEEEPRAEKESKPTYTTSANTTSSSFKSKNEFKATMLPIYERILSQMGLNTAYAKALVAQDGLESAWGTKPSGKFNFGGIKGKGSVKRTREVINGKDVYINDSFRDFDSLEDYAKYKISLLNNNRYKAFTGDISGFADRVFRGGYATDPKYADTLKRVIASAKHGGILKFQAGGTGEIRPDNRSWLKKKLDYINTKYNSSKWVSSAPATVLADFTPFGLFHYAAQGDPDTAKLAILPGAAGIVKAEKIIEPTAKAVKEGLETVYNHYGDNVAKYFQGSLENLRNPDITLTLEERLKVPKKLENIEIADDLRHEYSFFTNSTGVPTLKVSSTATNPKYVGEKAAAKQFLQELVGTTSNNGIKSMTIPEKELFARRYGPTTTSTLSEKDIYSRLMAYKAETGITSSFEKLTEKEAKDLFSKAYDSNLFHSKGEKELFWEKNKDKILSIFRRVPALLGAGIVGDKIIKSKAGTKLKDPKAVGEVSSQETIKWMQDKNGEVSYARRHKHNYPEFWGRLTQLNKESISDWEDPRSHATHKLSWGTNEDKVIVYPEVQKINGKLIDFSRPPYHQFAGMDNALETGNYVEAPSEDIADNFTKTYKQNYKGFPDRDIFSNEADRKTFHLRSDKANYLYRKLLDAGYNNIQASAIIGSAFVEGQLLENAREKGNSRRGYGIMQWTDPTRLQNLKNFKSKTANNEFERQVDFLIHELKDNSVWNSKGSTLQQFLDAQDIDTATILFTKGYLNPKTGLEHFDRRKEVARYYNDNTPDYNFNIF